tara:strand:- start:1650 stop:3260 length:1611 start_codon:yes stop_codon:yes gene_type:complete
MVRSAGLLLSVIGTLALMGCGEKQETSRPISNLTQAELEAGHELLVNNCSGCHVERADGTLSRISEVRKTPEGWDMNIARMMIFHGAYFEPEDRRAMVKFLSDTQGLAPSETTAHRAILERQHNVIEQNDDQNMMDMCARCHTYARVALQRRDAEEWRKLVHMHLGQWASIEYQMLARHRDWRDDALGPIADQLGQMYPLQTAAWTEWKNTPWPDYAGEWRLVGHWPGKGGLEGMMTIKALGDDRYEALYTMRLSGGEALEGTAKSTVHTGYEWRGSGTLGGDKVRQVLAATPDGKMLKGRLFLDQYKEIGAHVTAVRLEGTGSRILSTIPAALKIGEEATLTINGVGLSGDLVIPGVETEILERSATRLVVKARATGNAGKAEMSIGEARGQIVLYDRVDYIKVTPDYGISRVGDNGGPIPKVHAQFEAIGYHNGPDGKPETADDIRLGVMKARWHAEPYNEIAREMEDVKYAGELRQNGLFVPAGAGPNPERKYGTNNAGDLAIVATVKDGERELSARAHLIATVQRWNTPPIL